MDDYRRLLGELTKFRRPAVAFSGGVDSTFLLRAVKDAFGRADAFLASCAFVPPKELLEARELAASIGAALYEIPVDVLADPAIAGNPADRCYTCKKRLFIALWDAARAQGCDALLEGSHADDLNDYRPGRRALEELGVQSPMMSAGIGKARIRELSRELDLPTWDKPAMACLATRFPTGETLTPEGIARVARAEETLAELGFPAVRVRSHGEVARIELPPAQMEGALARRNEISEAARRAGFRFAALDLDGYKMGSMNA